MVEQSPQPSTHDLRSSSESRPDRAAHGRPPLPSRQSAGGLDRARKRTAGPLYFPLWSLGFTLLSALILSVAAVLALISLRAGDSLPQAEPVIQIVVADPANISEPISNDADEVNPASTSGDVELVIAGQAPADLAMEGPLLPTVDVVPTPVPITVGAGVEVSGVGNQELNVRNQPGLSQSQILFRAPEGSAFDIIGGPREADGFSWWKVRDRQFQVEGWAVGNYLRVIS
ncbi:MAG: SH3 domain-containing protein [Chloroflexi bacterium]|nr:SH3 domain-containing protein [Chloroflexota bacterium]